MKRRTKVDKTDRAALVSRSPEWPKIKQQHLNLEPNCIACRAKGHKAVELEVHHIFPLQHCIALDRPDLELDPRNLVTLCENNAGLAGENHHLLIGHLDDLKSFNIYAKWDARILFHGISTEVIKKISIWEMKFGSKPKHLEEMSEEEKKELKELMDTTFPVLKLRT